MHVYVVTREGIKTKRYAVPVGDVFYADGVLYMQTDRYTPVDLSSGRIVQSPITPDHPVTWFPRSEVRVQQ